MSKKLTVRRNERLTYEVHIEKGNPTEKFVGGQSLSLDRLAVELGQHGCSQEVTEKALQDVNSAGSTIILL